MIYIFGASLLTFLVVTLVGIRRDNQIQVEARFGQLDDAPSGFARRNIFVGPNGRRVSLVNKVVASVNGSSCAHLGIDDGTFVIAQRLDETSRAALSRGDVVIIGDKDIPPRLRKITRISGDEVFFEQSAVAHLRPRKKANVIGKVLMSVAPESAELQSNELEESKIKFGA